MNVISFGSFFIFSLFSLSAQYKVIHPIENNSLNSVKCIIHFYQKYANKQSYTESVVKISFQNNKFTFHNHFLKAFNDYHHDYFNSTILVDFRSNYIRSFRRWKKIGIYILFIENESEVDQTIITWKNSSSWDPFASVLVIFCGQQSSLGIDIQARNVFQTFLRYEMNRVFVIQINVQRKFVELFSWFSSNNNRFLNEVKSVQSLEKCYFSSLSQTFQITNSKEIKLNDFQQCPLRISASIYPPLVTLVDGFWSGAEIFVTKIVAEKLNTSIEVTMNLNDRNGQRIDGIRELDKPLFNE